jgi:3-hydroxyisobutyrate dehydrogenase-like beta-hydroxyacid dehydrogenase
VRTVGMVGLGLMGTAMSTRLLRAGFDVLGYDVDQPARQALEDAGGRVGESAAQVALECDTVMLSLPDADVAAAVIEAMKASLRAGQVIVDTTTGDPQQAEAAGGRLAARGVRFLDATIAGSSAQVYDGQVIVMAGGTSEAFSRAREVLETFAREVFHVGPWGSGSRMKLVVNLVLGLNRAVLAEGLSLADALGLDQRAALGILRTSAAYSRVMDTKGDKMLARDFSPQARLSQHLKDVKLILAAAERTGIELPLSLQHRALLEAVEAAGHGQLDNSAIVLAFLKPRTSS